MRTRFDLAHYTNRKDVRPVLITYTDRGSLVTGFHSSALKKFRQVKKHENALFFINGVDHGKWEEITAPFPDGTAVVIGDATSQEPPVFTERQTSALHAAPVMYLHSETYVDDDAKKQLSRAAALPGMIRCVGMPDLHVGSSAFPVGAAFLSKHIHPELVGSDIGCGMSLFPLSHLHSERLSDKVLHRLSRTLGSHGFPGGIDGYASSVTHHERTLEHAERFGTIGGGNHFAELQVVHELHEPGIIDKDIPYILVHSGSRTLGKAIFAQYQADKDISAYQEGHDLAVTWASESRKAIGQRFAALCGADSIGDMGDPRALDVVLDITHNSYVPADDTFLHRKGAAPMDSGLVAIPGSRGTFTYIVRPTGDVHILAKCASSVAHGAGRAMSRGAVGKMLRNRYKRAEGIEALSRTKFNGYVVYDQDRVEILYEEAPESYKDIDLVVQDLVAVGAVTVVAVMKPVITCKL